MLEYKLIYSLQIGSHIHIHWYQFHYFFFQPKFVTQDKKTSTEI